MIFISLEINQISLKQTTRLSENISFDKKSDGSIVVSLKLPGSIYLNDQSFATIKSHEIILTIITMLYLTKKIKIKPLYGYTGLLPDVYKTSVHTIHYSCNNDKRNYERQLEISISDFLSNIEAITIDKLPTSILNYALIHA